MIITCVSSSIVGNDEAFEAVLRAREYKAESDSEDSLFIVPVRAKDARSRQEPNSETSPVRDKCASRYC